MQKANKDQNLPGTLIMAANSLGLAVDIPLRSLSAVQNADLLIFEEDRIARQVLKAAGVTRKYLKFNEHGQKDTLKWLAQALSSGKTVLYMSDQGSPCLADPGAPLLAVAYKVKARVQVIAGPSSLTAAISASPLDLSSFFYAGFLPRGQEQRESKLQQLSGLQTPLIIMDTPYRLADVLESVQRVWGSKAKASLSVDISGEDEEHIFASLAQIQERAKELAAVKKMNFVLILPVLSSGKPAAQFSQTLPC